jgi:signal transduction histidine kinase/AmiR/NasT family two-component response regulator
LAGLTLCLTAQGAVLPALPVDVSPPMVELAERVAVCADSSTNLSIDDVVAGRCTFSAPATVSMAQGFSNKAWWLRVTLTNPTTQPVERWLSVGHPRISYVQMFSRSQPDTAWQHARSGLWVPAVQRPLVATTAVFPLTIPAAGVIEVFIRVQSETAVDLTPTLWQMQSYLQTYHLMQVAHAAALGGLLLTGLFSVAIFFQFRERSFLYYGLATLCEIGSEMVHSGLLAQYLWPADRPFSIEVLPASVGGAAIFFTLFLRAYLGDLMRFRKTALLFYASLAVMLTSLLWAIFIQYRQGAMAWSFTVVLVLALSVSLMIQAARAGDKSARTLVASFLAISLLELLRFGITLGLKSTTLTLIAGAPWAIVLTAPLILAGIARRSRENRDQVMQAQHASAARSHVLAQISHDLRAPLSTILGFARMLEKQTPNLTPSEGGAVIARSSERLLAQINDLLDLARLDVGRLSISPASFPLQLWLDDVAVSAELMATEAGNRFVLNKSGALPPTVVADAGRLRQVIDNLLTNANRATANGQIGLNIRAEQLNESEVRLYFEVDDTGAGILPSEQTRIFEPFEQGEKSEERRHAGIGLGLAIVSDLVKLMGGNITLTSTLGVGSLFRFSIVCSLGDAEASNKHTPASGMESDSATQASDDTPPPTNAAVAGRRILIADDDPHERIVLANLLETAGYSVQVVANGFAAGEALQQQFDAVITDQFMPNGDGWYVLEAACKRWRDLPVILVSSAPSSPPADRTSNHRFSAVLSKPIIEVDLLTTLAHFSGSVPLAAPHPKQLSELRELINTGQVTLIDEWASNLKSATPEFSGFADAVKAAVIRIDFPRLKQLAGDSD